MILWLCVLMFAGGFACGAPNPGSESAGTSRLGNIFEDRRLDSCDSCRVTGSFDCCTFVLDQQTVAND